jgi:hypothetical protein
MTETFRRVQTALRNTKEHGVDLTHPMGAVIGDRTYPVINKAMVIDSLGERHSFQIPLENRHRVRWSFTNQPDDNLLYAHSYVTYPTQYGDWGMPNAREFGVLKDYPPFDTFHEKMKEHSSEKMRGIRVYDYGHRSENVPDDELEEHYRIGKASREKRMADYPLEAFREEMRYPHLIQIHYKPIPGGSLYSGQYDVKTERLSMFKRDEEGGNKERHEGDGPHV